ncbi:hypothetical protein [Silvibacterium sp.]|uniref:hypothetical protein n=1 Tax=Silvibacterium sp. TaxID=1964179 RepID=UPI0039E5AF5E
MSDSTTGPIGLIGLGLVVMLGAFWLQRLRWRRRRRKGRRGHLPSIGALGLALQNLQLFVHPSTEYTIEERLKEAADKEDDGDTADPAKHLERQLRRVRRGERLDVLTAKLPDEVESR